MTVTMPIPPIDARVATASMPTPSSWDVAKTAIERAVATDFKTILILGFAAPAGDPLAWLAHHQGVPSMYWRGRDGWEYAALGASHVVAGTGEGAMRKVADEAARFTRECIVHEPIPLTRRPRFFGGFAFDPSRVDADLWREGGFGDAVMVLPEAMYARREEQSYLFFSFEVTPRSTPDTLVDRFALLNQHYWSGFDASSLIADAGVILSGASGRDDHERWMQHSTQILQQIESGALDKVVLAIRQTVGLSRVERGAFNPWSIVGSLRDFDPACYQFGIQLSDRHAFLGASPERLFRLAGRRLESEAIAGTIGRGKDEAGDRALGERLLASLKDQLEHRFVVDAVRDGLASLSSDGVTGTDAQLDLVRLRTLQHLRSVMSVGVRDDVTVGEILGTLHPTPAVGGVPRDQAREAIRLHEADSRGWYGGPVGWIGADAAEFAVGIRSALVSSDQAWVYAGAGLVSGSIPENEWREIQDKLQAFRSAVNSPRQTP